MQWTCSCYHCARFVGHHSLAVRSPPSASACAGGSALHFGCCHWKRVKVLPPSSAHLITAAVGGSRFEIGMFAPGRCSATVRCASNISSNTKLLVSLCGQHCRRISSVCHCTSRDCDSNGAFRDEVRGWSSKKHRFAHDSTDQFKQLLAAVWYQYPCAHLFLLPSMWPIMSRDTFHRAVPKKFGRCRVSIDVPMSAC
eukprot:1075536-Amphidinium_carterae.1